MKDENTLSKLTLGSYPHLLGFEQLERLLERSAKAGNEGYPPYNIEQTSDFSYRITLAVAGVAEEDLSITIEDRQLVIRGRQRDDSEGAYSCTVASRRVSSSACSCWPTVSKWARRSWENGLLHVDLTRAVPETVVQTINIRKG